MHEYRMRINVDEVSSASSQLSDYLQHSKNAKSLESLRGFEGTAQVIYFAALDHLILNQKDDFYFIA